MKKSLLIPLIFSSALFVGCSGTPEKAPENAPSVPEPANPQQAPQPEAVLPAELQWKSLYPRRKDDQVMAMYKRAQKLIEEQRGVSGELNHWSNDFGPWLVVVLEAERDPELMALDEEPPRNPAFLVDMAAGKVVDTNDWKSARPFIEAQIKVYQRGFSDDEARQKFLRRFVSSVSVVAFGNTDYLEDATYAPEPVSEPSFKYGTEKSELTYYIASHGMTLSYTQCKLTVTEAAIVFNSEIVK